MVKCDIDTPNFRAIIRSTKYLLHRLLDSKICKYTIYENWKRAIKHLQVLKCHKTKIQCLDSKSRWKWTCLFPSPSHVWFCQQMFRTVGQTYAKPLLFSPQATYVLLQKREGEKYQVILIFPIPIPRVVFGGLKQF